MNNPLY